MGSEDFFGRIFLSAQADKKTGLSAPIFFAAKPQKRISATIQVAWASSNFAEQNYDQPLARPNSTQRLAFSKALAPVHIKYLF